MNDKPDPTDAQVYRAFMLHVKKLEKQAIAGDKDAIRSLACMALLAEGFKYEGPDPDDGEDIHVDGAEIIDFTKYKLVA